MKHLLLICLLILLGAGCVSVPFLVPEVTATDIDVTTGSSLVLMEKTLGLPMMPGKNGRETIVTVDELERTDTTTVSWQRKEERETEASKQARQDAIRRIAQGEDIVRPEPIYEQITVAGTVKSEGLDDAHRLLLPMFWPEGTGKPVVQKSSVLWLSKAQYQELIEKNETEIQLSAVDAGLQDVVDLAAVAQEQLQKLTGNNGAHVDSYGLTKAKFVGVNDFTLIYNDKKIRVPVMEIENGLATYTVLADPENPLVLEVNLKAWSYGAEVLEALKIETELSGYKVSSITNK